MTGPSGAGKSTLLHIAGGLDAPDSGTVAVAGQDVWAKSARARAAFRRRNLGFVFQFFNLVPMLTAVENVSLPLVLDGMPARSADARAEELLQRVGLGDRARHRPAELSGGQMQRVAVARALVARPSIILADEPTGNLDSHSSTEVLDLLRSLSDEDGAAVVTGDTRPEPRRATAPASCIWSTGTRAPSTPPRPSRSDDAIGCAPDGCPSGASTSPR